MELLFRDDRVVVCVKPAGVLSTDEPGGLPELLRGELGTDTVKTVHRLDRAVGGVMVCALTRRAAADLSAQVRDGRFQKEYLAVTHGGPAEPRGSLCSWLWRDTAARKTLVVPADTSGAQMARLDYAVLEEREGLALLAIRLHTGRTHQIRCQLSHGGWPIVGDRKYGAPDGPAPIALWSHAIAFCHPRTGEELTFRRDPPDIPPWRLFYGR